jgi:hypothetical protein
VLVLIVPAGRNFFDLVMPDGGELAMAGFLIAVSAPALALGAYVASHVGHVDD